MVLVMLTAKDMKKAPTALKAHDWLAKHPEALEKNKGKWIAVDPAEKGNKITATGKVLSDVLRQIGVEKQEQVLFTKVPRNLGAVCCY